MSDNRDTFHSSSREMVVEHLFLAVMLRRLWAARFADVEVLRPEVDGADYDLVVEHGGVLRHIQLKSTQESGKRANVGVNIKLARKPSGCVLWLFFDGRLDIIKYGWFGSAAGRPLPSLDGFKTGKHTKGDSTGSKAERPNIRVIPKGSFEWLASVDEVIRRLFGGFGGVGPES